MARRSGAVRGLLLAVDLAFLTALALAPLAWFADPLRWAPGPLQLTVKWGWKPFLAPFLLLGVRAVLQRWFPVAPGLRRGPLDIQAVQKATLAVGVSVLSLLAVEKGLQLLGFESQVAPIVIRGQGTEAVDTSRGLVPDPELMWRFNPGAEFLGLRINRLGFLDREVDAVKAPGAIRVISMGDSCTGMGPQPYSQFLHDMLTAAPPTPQPWEAFNMGVHGYSSVSGLRLFRLRGKALAPDVVTIYFGWNDHWLAGRLPDSQRMAVRVGAFAGALHERLRRKRVGQIVIQALGRVPTLRKGAPKGYRVPPDEYRSTLETFVDEVRSAGAVPVLITAPRARRLTGLLIVNGQARSLEETIRAHDQYVEITREVARARKVRLLDLAALYSKPALRAYFHKDGIHLRRAGRERLAKELYRLLSELAASEEWRSRASAP